MITHYDYPPSQNAYKVRLLLNRLDRPYVTKIVPIFASEAGSDLTAFPAVAAWIERVRSQSYPLEASHPYAIDPQLSKELP